MPKVSIIITSYNRPALLAEAINSAVNQTLKDIEIILLDDCSPKPGVRATIGRFCEKDKRIKAFYAKSNIGNLSMMWNIGIDLSCGEYITTLDDDNIKVPEFCEKMAGFLDRNSEYDAVACYMNMMKEGQIIGLFDMPGKMTKESIAKENHVDSGCMLYRRSLIDKIGYYDERLRSSEDWDFVKRVMLETENGFGIIREPLLLYRWHPENRSKIAVAQLGDLENKKTIGYRKKYLPKIDVLLFHPNRKKITLSQNNVLSGVESALEYLEFVNLESVPDDQIRFIPSKSQYDWVINFMPFMLAESDVQIIRKLGREVCNLHIEDPQAAKQNLARAKYATYVITNDISVTQYYEAVVGSGKVGFCPSISFDDINLKVADLEDFKLRHKVVFLGTAYTSRKRFAAGLSERLKKQILFVGDGWNNVPNQIGERSQAEVFDLLNQTKIVILRGRENSDLGGTKDSYRPESVVRGYFEAASNALVMMDSARKHHSFESGEVVFYDDGKDLEDKINYYLANEYERCDIVENAKKEVLRNYTYRVRIRELLNQLRSQRFNLEIK